MLTSTLRQTAFAVVACSILSACGGGSGASTHTGVFVDSAVQGLSYTATPSGLSGTTDAAGHFDYQDGDSVTFKLGNVTLGTVPAVAQVTPKSIGDASAPNSTSDAANIASNIARFLQTFDADGNPDNGITINPAAIEAATPVNFNQTPDAFSGDAGYTALVQSTGATPISNDQASAHAERSFLAQLAGTWYFKGTGPSASKLLTVTFFTDGTYLKGGEEDDAGCGGIDGNGNGIELGDFNYDAANATITVTKVRKNTDGSCGLENGTVLTNVAINGNTLTVTSPDGTSTFTKPDNNGIVGSWLADQPFIGKQLTHPVVVTFFANGDYVMVDSGISEVDTDPADGAAPGTERGKWSVNGSGALTVSQTLDTNGPGVGFSDLAANTTLIVGSDGKLTLTEPNFDTVVFTRLPLTPKISAGDLAGAWYITDDQNPVNESAAQNYVVFNGDGTYLLGSQEDDANCHDDYANNSATSANTASYADGSNGSEAAHWRLDTGTGILSTKGLIFETDGSCGLYNVYSKFPENHLILDKVDANTINVTSYEYQDGGTGENNTGTFVAIHSVLKRIPATTSSLIGAWVKDGSQQTILFFGNNSFFTIGGSDAGGVIRGSYSLSGGTLTRTVDGSDANCIDTISATSMCSVSPAVPDAESISFGSDNKTFTVGSDTYRKL